MDGEGQTQHLIGQWRDGAVDGRDSLIDRLYPELMQIAAARVRGEGGTSLSTGDLVNDAVMRILRIEQFNLNDRAHFLALASRLMRNILTDRARARNADKRKHQKVELSTQLACDPVIDLIELDLALQRLGEIDPQLADIVEMRYFGGMSTDDVAHAVGLSPATVKRRWQVARAWLADSITDGGRA